MKASADENNQQIFVQKIWSLLFNKLPCKYRIRRIHTGKTNTGNVFSNHGRTGLVCVLLVLGRSVLVHGCCGSILGELLIELGSEWEMRFV